MKSSELCLVTAGSPVCSQEGLLWRIHHLPDPLHGAAHAAVGRAWRQAPALHGSRSRAVRRPHPHGSGAGSAPLGCKCVPTSSLLCFLPCPNSRFLIPIAFQQTNRPVPVVYSLNTEFQLCNNEKVFLMDPTKSEMSLAEMDYKGAFSKGRIYISCSACAQCFCLHSFHFLERKGQNPAVALPLPQQQMTF